MRRILPSSPAGVRSLTEVAPFLLQRLGEPGVRSAVVLMIDGLGHRQLAERSGHARVLRARSGEDAVALTVFPSTTAAALTSLTTGVHPGEHGIVGYSVRLPDGRATNQLQGWERDGIDPERWQPVPTMFQRATQAGHRAFVVNRPRYRETGFTRAAFRGAEFVAAESLEDRLAGAVELARRTPGALVYGYANELDVAAHKYGWRSGAWTALLEAVDQQIHDVLTRLPADVGLIITADHGVVDVPGPQQRIIEPGSPLWEGVTLMAGEPRMLHLSTDDGAAAAVAARWQQAEGDAAWVLTREEAIAQGLFGPVIRPDALSRIGDVVVAAATDIAYYDGRLTDTAARSMVGQHGSITDEERLVPLLRLGAFEHD